MNGDKAKYNKLIAKAKEFGRQGQLERALGLFEKAFKIHQSEKLGRKIEKLKVMFGVTISNTRKRVSSGCPNIEKRVEKRDMKSFFNHFEMFGCLIKHSFTCLI